MSAPRCTQCNTGGSGGGSGAGSGPAEDKKVEEGGDGDEARGDDARTDGKGGGVRGGDAGDDGGDAGDDTRFHAANAPIVASPPVAKSTIATIAQTRRHRLGRDELIVAGAFDDAVTVVPASNDMAIAAGVMMPREFARMAGRVFL